MAGISYGQELTKGILRENPLFVLVLGTCPSMAVTTSMVNGLGMGIAATFVLVMSNIAISALRKVIPPAIRIPCYITIIASFVTLVEMLMEAYMFPLHQALGIFLPLIVVNCIILGRAEAFASQNSVGRSALDGLGMGLGFTLALLILGTIREILGNGTILVGTPLETAILGSAFKENSMLVMILPPGGFLTLGLLIAGLNKLKARKTDKTADDAAPAAVAGKAV